MAFNLYLTRIKDVFLGWPTSGSLGASWNEPVSPFSTLGKEGAGEREEKEDGGKRSLLPTSIYAKGTDEEYASHRFHYWYWWTITSHKPDLHCKFYLIVCIWLLNSGSSKHFTIGSVWACKYFNCVTTSVLFSTSSTMKKKRF